jgi:hypothetical protein
MTPHLKRVAVGSGGHGRARVWSRQPLATASIVTCCAVIAVGCGSSDGLVPVAGVVQFDGAPLDRTAVTFLPTSPAAGPGGMAITDASGRFVVHSPQGKRGMAAGTYKVTVSRREPKTPVTEGSAVIDSDLVEQVPAKYSDPEKTELTATIGARGDGALRFELSGEPK